MTLFMKIMPEKNFELSKNLKLPREAFFYTNVSPNCEMLSAPKCYYAYGNLTTGEKILVLEDLEGYMNSGFAFGQVNPACIRPDFDEKAKDLKFMTK